MIERATIMASGGRVDVGALLDGRPLDGGTSDPGDKVTPPVKLKALGEASISRAALKRTSG